LKRVLHKVETILSDGGLYSQAIVRMRTNGCALVAPIIDDCNRHRLGFARSLQGTAPDRASTYYVAESRIGFDDGSSDACEDLVERCDKPILYLGFNTTGNQV
jgi:hypothetical protein